MGQIPEALRKEVMGHFDENRVVYLATSESDQPRVRPVTLVTIGPDLWILTGSSDAKIKQVKNNPRIEICYPVEREENTGYIRLSGIALNINDKNTRREIAEQVGFFNKYWDSPDDPEFSLLQTRFENIEYLKPGDLIAEKYRL